MSVINVLCHQDNAEVGFCCACARDEILREFHAEADAVVVCVIVDITERRAEGFDYGDEFNDGNIVTSVGVNRQS